MNDRARRAGQATFGTAALHLTDLRHYNVFGQYQRWYDREPARMKSIKIRDAVADDAVAACAVMRRSIAELCRADHRDDPAVLQRWLSNKRPEIFASWIRPGNSLLVAVEDDIILAVGSITDSGEITSNYVSPDARFRGVSSALLAALEDRARARGVAVCTLASTETARRFYRARGYAETGPADGKFGTAGGYPMSKRLAPG